MSAGSEIPQDVARRLQLAMFRGNEPSGALLELRYRRPQGTVRRDDFYDARDLDRVSAEIDRLSLHADVWVGAAPRTCRDGTANGIAHVWALWVDLDSRDALTRLAAFPIQPSIVVRSGSDDCAHAYWALREPLLPADAQRGNRRLALALAGDMAATDPARILRPAGARNWKHDPPREVICTRLELTAFTGLQVVGDLPDSHHYLPRARAVCGPDPAGPDRTLDGLVRTVRDAEVGNRNHACFWAACRVVDHAHAGELDEQTALAEIRAAALGVGLPEDEVDATLRSRRATRQAA